VVRPDNGIEGVWERKREWAEEGGSQREALKARE